MSARFSLKLPSGQNKAGNMVAYMILNFCNTTGNRGWEDSRKEEPVF